MEYQLYAMDTSSFDPPWSRGSLFKEAEKYPFWVPPAISIAVVSTEENKLLRSETIMDVMGNCYRLVGDLLHSLASHCKPVMKLGAGDDVSAAEAPQGMQKLDELAARALTAVFGMDSNGRIKKEKARRVVQRLGLMAEDEEGFGLEEEEEEEELQAEEIVGPAAEEETDELKRAELLRRAFMVFDKDGDGFIDSSEVKRVLECLGLANAGWDMVEFERMVEVADLNFDGKVDFSEFEQMMMSAK